MLCLLSVVITKLCELGIWAIWEIEKSKCLHRTLKMKVKLLSVSQYFTKHHVYILPCGRQRCTNSRFTSFLVCVIASEPIFHMRIQFHTSISTRTESRAEATIYINIDGQINKTVQGKRNK